MTGAPGLAGFVTAARALVGERFVMDAPEDLFVYSYDGTIDRAVPEVVVAPGTAAELAAVMRLAWEHRLPVVPRGAGTGLSGGAIPAEGTLVLVTSRLNRILEIDPANRWAVVEPGVVNQDLSTAAAPSGLFFAPDPSSQRASTIGGNIAENSGGPHCLAYGATTVHVLAVDVVLADGRQVTLDGRHAAPVGYDLCGAFVGSEGTCGMVTRAVVRMLPLPPAVATLLAVFDDLGRASETVSAIIAAGIVPQALEMMDDVTIAAVQAGMDAGYPLGAKAVLLIEVEGGPAEVQVQTEAILAVCQAQGAVDVQAATTAEARARLWTGRKGALGALGRYKPNYYILDGVVPRTRVPEVLAQSNAVAAEFGFLIANVYHAGDGNLHPLLLFDEQEPGALERVLEAGERIMRLCVDAGGAVSGEHGIGLEKQDFLAWIFTPDDLATMDRVRGVFDPESRLNPGKVFPDARHAPAVRWRPPSRATNSLVYK